MRGYTYLNENVRRHINQVVKETLNEVSVTEPPVRYDWIYENDKLSRIMLSTRELKSCELLEKVDSKKFKYLRGALFVQEKQVIVVDERGYEKRNNFVYGHEYAHWKLPSHLALLYRCSQFDLSPKARKQLEREANYFSSELSFMGDVFFDRLQSSTLSIENIKSLSDTFNMSIEATLRRTVELELRPCALMSLILDEEDEDNFLRIRYCVHSASFEKNYGVIGRDRTFSKKHNLSTIITNPINRMLKECECNLSFGQKKVQMNAELWMNDWNILVLVQPN